MNDEHRAAELLNLAAEPPAGMEPPVRQLLDRARRARRSRFAALAGITAVVVAAAAVGLPVLASSLRHSRARPPAAAARLSVSASQLARFRWVRLASSPVGKASAELVVWTGRELLELGDDPGRAGASFGPATGRWHRIAAPPSAVALGMDSANVTSVWTGRLLFVIAGLAPRSRHFIAGIYDPAANRWSTTLLPVALAGLEPLCPNCLRASGSIVWPQHEAAAWNGREIIVADARSGVVRAAAYNPATGRWAMMSPPPPRRHPAEQVAMIAAGSRVILWSMWSQPTARSQLTFGVDVMVLGRDGGWTPIAAGWPQNRTVRPPVLAGSQIMVPPAEFWCGTCPGPPGNVPVYLASAATLRGSYLPAGPVDQYSPAVFWTGKAVIEIDFTCYGRYCSLPGPAAAWSPQTAASEAISDPWRMLRTPPSVLYTAVWTGRELLALGPAGLLVAFRR